MHNRKNNMAMTLAVIIAGAFLLSACHTISGMGQDISSVGRSISRTAN